MEPVVTLPSRVDGRAQLVLGTMNFGARTPESEAKAIVDRALDAGIQWFDTANLYGEGASEEILGRALKGSGGKAASAYVASKVGLLGMAKGKKEGLRPEVIQAACDASLARLGRDALDLYYLHAPDHDVPLAESVAAIGELLEAGKIRAWGMSNYASWQILEAGIFADRMGIPRPVASQQMYNLVVRQLDVEYFKYVRAYPIHTTVYNPLAGGLLAGTIKGDEKPAKGSRFDGNRLYERRYATDVMKGEAEEYAAIASQKISLPPDARKKIDAIRIAYAGTDATYAR